MRSFLLAAGLLTLAVPAFAADFSAPIVDPETGQPMHESTAAGSPVVTLGALASQALFMSFPDEQNLDPQEKFTRGLLGIKILKAKGDLQLTVDELALVKKLIGKAFSPLVVAEAWPMLDPATVQQH